MVATAPRVTLQAGDSGAGCGTGPRIFMCTGVLIPHIHSCIVPPQHCNIVIAHARDSSGCRIMQGEVRGNPFLSINGNVPL